MIFLNRLVSRLVCDKMNLKKEDENLYLEATDLIVRRQNMKKVSVSLICVAILVMASVVFAQKEGPCVEDIAKFCGNVKQGEGRIAVCLTQNEAQLSMACKMHLAWVKEAVKEAHQVCEDDIMMYCAGVQPGEGRIMKCLKANKSHLSSGCKMKLFEAEKEMKEMK